MPKTTTRKAKAGGCRMQYVGSCAATLHSEGASLPLEPGVVVTIPEAVAESLLRQTPYLWRRAEDERIGE